MGPSLNARAEPPIVLTMGDPAGIGPEITCLAWERLRVDGPAFAAIGDPDAYAAAAAALGRTIPVRLVDEPSLAGAAFADTLPVLAHGRCAAPIVPGQPDASNAGAVGASIDAAARLALAGGARAMVTNPIAKAVLYESGFPFPGHTEFLADLTKDAPCPEPRGPVMMLVGGGLKVALATIHVPLRDVSAALSVDGLVRTARVVDRTLRQDFGLASPKIAFAGLNPHAGESGDLGREEIEVINPAAARLRSEHGLNVTDAVSGDAVFAPHERGRFDAVIAMYHDQGLIPVKTLDFDGGVNVTLGLPIVRTSPDHGAAFAIAGKGVARAESLLAAIALADEIATRRARVPA
jgi:4-hydroxythreonine-4-phosphate dehydrogenase